MYKFLNFKLVIPTPTAFLSSTKEDSSFQLWHSTLGHPTLTIVSRVLKSCNLPFSISRSLCSLCCLGKSHQLPFYDSTSIYQSPLELMYLDISNTTVIPSINGARYYINIIDTFSKYTWLYLVHSRSSSDQYFCISNVWLNCNLVTKLKCYKVVMLLSMWTYLCICRLMV